MLPCRDIMFSGCSELRAYNYIPVISFSFQPFGLVLSLCVICIEQTSAFLCQRTLCPFCVLTPSLHSFVHPSILSVCSSLSFPALQSEGQYQQNGFGRAESWHHPAHPCPEERPSCQLRPAGPAGLLAGWTTEHTQGQRRWSHGKTLPHHNEWFLCSGI